MLQLIAPLPFVIPVAFLPLAFLPIALLPLLLQLIALLPYRIKILNRVHGLKIKN